MSVPELRQEIINGCLDIFMQNGLAETSMRDLARGVNRNPATLYWYFEDKTAAVVACAEEAAVRIEESLIHKALEDVENPERLLQNLQDRSSQMKPLMKFFASACSQQRYEEALKPVLTRLSERYRYYVERFAAQLECDPEELAPYVYTIINTMSSYMIFGQEGFMAPQLQLIRRLHQEFLDARNARRQKIV